MATFTIKIAGVPVELETQILPQENLFSRYLCEEEPAFRIVSSPEEIRRMKRAMGYVPQSDAAYEYITLLMLLAKELLSRDILLIHGSAVAVDGEAYIFSALGGTGKSTHVSLWRKVLPELGHEVKMINDDKPLLRFEGDTVYACGSPWSGKHFLDSNIEVPLRGLCFLERGKENRIEHLPPLDVMPRLLLHAYRPLKEPDLIRKAIYLYDRLANRVPAYVLKCNMEPEAAVIAFEGMRPKPEA